MIHPEPHVRDQDLLLAIDGELSKPRAAQVAAHLAHCWACRARRGELEGAIAGFMRLHRASLDVAVPPGAGPAALLRARMAAATPTGVHWRFAAPLSAGAVVALLATVGGLTWLTGQPASAGPLPDSRLTPGATRAISKDQVCVARAGQDEGRTAPADLASQVFREYRIGTPRPRAYEVDYLISPALGGADDIRNLWPQPYAEGMWTSRVKDALEDHLRRLVCEGTIDLATAQHEIASDWIAAYRKYFATRRPLAAHALFVKDRPWE